MMNIWNFFDIKYFKRLQIYMYYQQNFEGERVKIVKILDFSCLVFRLKDKLYLRFCPFLFSVIRYHLSSKSEEMTCMFFIFPFSLACVLCLMSPLETHSFLNRLPGSSWGMR